MPPTDHTTTMGWSPDQLDRIGRAAELHIALLRSDGTSRRALPIWVVRHDDDVYVRSVNGRAAAWFRIAVARHRAHVQAGGVAAEVVLHDLGDGGDDLAGALDAAYRDKYGNGSAVDHITSPDARAATLRLALNATD